MRIAGILTLIAACICAFLGITFAIGAVGGPSHLVSPFASVVAAIGLLGFGGGLGAGILILKGRMSHLAAAGMALMLPEGFIVTIMGGWFFGVPIFLLVLISALLLGIPMKKYRITLICVLVIVGIVSFCYLKSAPESDRTYPETKGEYLIRVPHDQWIRDTAGYLLKATRELTDDDLETLEQHGIYELYPTTDPVIYYGLIVEEEVITIEALPFILMSTYHRLKFDCGTPD